MSKILQTLTKNGLLMSRKGKGGGFALAKKSNNIRLIDVVMAIDHKIDFNVCLLGFKKCSSNHFCPMHDTFGKLKSEFREMLFGYNLKQLDGYNLLQLKK